MFSTNTLATLLPLFLGAPVISSSPVPPSANDALSSVIAIVRGENSTYTISEDTTSLIKRDPDTYGLGHLAKRESYATVQACYTSSCTNCYTVWDGSFSSNSACLSATNTACLIISNLQNANVEFWNRRSRTT
jgi:hypothetical protein